MNEKKFAIGIDLGATNIKGVLVDNNGNILKKKGQELFSRIFTMRGGACCH